MLFKVYPVLSHKKKKKKKKNAIYSDMGRPRDWHTEWSQVRQRKDKYHKIPLLCGILKKNGTNEFIYKRGVESHMWRISLWLRGNKGWRVAIIWEIRIDRHTILCTWIRASQVALLVKKQPANAGDKETWVRSLGKEDPWRRKWQSTPVFLPGESHGQRSLVGYSP